MNFDKWNFEKEGLLLEKIYLIQFTLKKINPFNSLEIQSDRKQCRAIQREFAIIKYQSLTAPVQSKVIHNQQKKIAVR